MQCNAHCTSAHICAINRFIVSQSDFIFLDNEQMHDWNCGEVQVRNITKVALDSINNRRFVRVFF